MRLIDIVEYDAKEAKIQWTTYSEGTVTINCRKTKDLPTVDAMPVVRCKDCVYFEPENAEEGNSYGRCRNNYAPCQNQQVEMMWFCADGEKDRGQMKRPKETSWDSLSEADLMEPMIRLFED